MPRNAFSYARNQTLVYSCVCEAGHAWTATSGGAGGVAGDAGYFNNLINDTTCYACDNGGAGSGSKTSCPGLLQSPAGFEVVVSTNGIRDAVRSPDAVRADDNFEGIITFRIITFRHHHFQDGASKAGTKCTEPGTYTAEGGLTSMAQCACAEGYEHTTAVCSACDTSSFKNRSGDGPCAPCMDNSHTSKSTSRYPDLGKDHSPFLVATVIYPSCHFQRRTPWLSAEVQRS